ncbi:type II CAAX prenyl endopeptidase Rce1 family protein [Kitasatospora sp. NPDC088783]|uniref:CPBP family glutamic-type intramembrane protease n=1 Tax=Kitasatospora sp. NPDC088783 TaxID=3364077 RepID=UPI0037F3C2BD
MLAVRNLLNALPARMPLPRPRFGQVGRTFAWAAAGAFAFAYLALTIASAWPGAREAASGGAPAGGTASELAMLRASVLWLALAVPAGVLLWLAERAPAVGLIRMPPRRLLTASCAVFCLAEAPMFFIGAAFELVRSHSQTVASYSGTGTGSTLWGDAAASVAAGISEEIVVLVLPVLAARRIAQAVVGVRLRRAGAVALVLVLVVARLSYHLEYGLAVVSLVPWAAVCVLLYLRSGTVLPFMVAHAAYDIALALVNRIAAHHGFAVAVMAFTAVAAAVVVGALAVGRTARHSIPEGSSRS